MFRTRQARARVPAGKIGKKRAPLVTPLHTFCAEVRRRSHHRGIAQPQVYVTFQIGGCIKRVWCNAHTGPLLMCLCTKPGVTQGSMEQVTRAEKVKDAALLSPARARLFFMKLDRKDPAEGELTQIVRRPGLAACSSAHRAPVTGRSHVTVPRRAAKAPFFAHSSDTCGYRSCVGGSRSDLNAVHLLVANHPALRAGE